MKITNADKIRNMNDKELADFLNDMEALNSFEWIDEFVEKFCDKCKPLAVKQAQSGEYVEFFACDIDKEKCPHGDAALWWLKQPVEQTNG